MDLNDKIRNYYTSYYHDQLGFTDWKSRVEARLNEEELFAKPVIDKLEKVLDYSFQGKKVLVVGAGTGAELFELNRRGAEAYGIEPNPLAVEILKDKCKLTNISRERIRKGVAETLPYKDDEFDFVYCYTVLEHVASVRRSLKSMFRVLKAGGRMFLETPNYWMPYEPHYKIIIPTILPRPFQKLFLRLSGRPTKFIDSINYISRRLIMDTMRHMPSLTIQIFDDFPKHFCRWSNPIYLLMRVFNMERDFWFIFLKLPERRR